MKRTIILYVFTILFSFNIYASGPIQTPQQFFGFVPGSDRNLIRYQPLIQYLQEMDEVSSRIKMFEIGQTPMEEKMFVVLISSENNINNLNPLKEINRKLALEPDLPDAVRDSLISQGKVFFLFTMSMHSTEVGPAQSVPDIVYDLATTTSPDKLHWLDQVVTMIVPCHNPDGMNMVIDNYYKYKNTKYEGCSMPGIYHKYVGHDNNRDFVNLTQLDNQAIARIYNQDWYPQVLMEKHQMGYYTVRYYVPPLIDPIAENIDAGIWTWTGVFGSNIITDMTNQNLSGVSQHYLFNEYWPGATTTSMWKNVISMFTECASVKMATPVYVEPTELQGYGKGLSEYKKSINMPLPWPGGWWHLSDIVEYEKASLYSCVKTASGHRKAILTFRNDLCKREVRRGQTEPPYYFVLPMQSQHDPGELYKMLDLIHEHGIAVFQLKKDFLLGSTQFRKGDFVLPLAQPFRPFIKEVMETQTYPVRHFTPDGEVIRPYDITSWSLPLHRGLTSIEINERSLSFESVFSECTGSFSPDNIIPDQFSAILLNGNFNDSYKAVFMAEEMDMEVERLTHAFSTDSKVLPEGSFLIHCKSGQRDNIRTIVDQLKISPLFINSTDQIKSKSLSLPRIGLVETYFHDMDAGWTRFVFDEYHIPYTTIRPGAFKKLDLSKFDLVVFPDSDKDILMSGKYKRQDEYVVPDYPPKYTKGIEKEGLQNLLRFIDQGGRVVAWGRSANLFEGSLELGEVPEKEIFQLPFRDISETLKKKGLYCPGSLIQINLKQDHPLTSGMPSSIGVFYRGRPAFTTSVPGFNMDRRVIAAIPEKPVLLSGYCEKEQLLEQKTMVVWIRKNKGQLVLFGFNPQFRGSTQAAYKLIFNAILL